MQQIQRRSQRRAQRLAAQKIRHERQSDLIEVAHELGRIPQIGGVVGASGDIAEVDAREAVDFSRVAAHRDGFWHDGGDLDEILGERCGGVFVYCAEGAAIPVVRDAFIAGFVG